MSFNQQDLIGETLAAALAQDYPNLEIVIADDGSTDATHAKILSTIAGYDGPHVVRVLDRGENVGIARNFQRLAGACSGDLIVYSDGDDISEADRVRRLVDRWRALGAGTAMLVSGYRPIDEAGEIVESFDEGVAFTTPRIEDAAAGRLYLLGATMAFTPDVFARFPALDADVKHVDRVIPFRVLLLGGAIDQVEAPLVRYRIVGGVSRGTASTARDYLKRFEPNRQERLLADARQRLADLDATPEADRGLRSNCLDKIQNHLTFLMFSKSHPLKYEAVALSRLTLDRDRMGIAKLYFKFRFQPLFGAYFHAAGVRP